MGDMPIESTLMTRTIGQTQKRVEGFNYDIRKHLLEYDDVLNRQRNTIYGARMRILKKENVNALLFPGVMQELCQTMVETLYPPTGVAAEMLVFEPARLERHVFSVLSFVLSFSAQERQRTELTREELTSLLAEKISAAYAQREALFGVEQMRDIERWVLLQCVDQSWKEHLLSLDQLRDGIGLRGYGQRDPLQEYKREAFELFRRMLGQIKQNALQSICQIQPNLAAQFAEEAESEALRRADKELRAAAAQHAEAPQVVGAPEGSGGL